MISKPYPELDELLRMVGEAGKRLADIKACEGAAGNISVCLGRQVDIGDRFPVLDEIELPLAVPKLAGATILVSGSGSRLCEYLDDPGANIACVVVNDDGQTAKMFSSPDRCFQRVTSEFNSHLAVHNDQVIATGTKFQAIIHAQPIHLTFLSHIPRYQDQQVLNTHLLRWQPETILNLPEGIAFIPFLVPGSAELMAATVAAMHDHQVVLWAKHGVMARSDVSVKRAVDLIEYAEAAAEYEYRNLVLGEPSEGLSESEIRAIRLSYFLQTTSV